jgi:hypothetical protein
MIRPVVTYLLTIYVKKKIVPNLVFFGVSGDCKKNLGQK